MRFRRQASAPTPLPPDPACEQVGAVLQAYLDGELGPQDAERVAEHLEHCDRCDIEAATVSKVVASIRRQRPDLEVESLDRLRRFVEELDDSDPPPR